MTKMSFFYFFTASRNLVYDLIFVGQTLFIASKHYVKYALGYDSMKCFQQCACELGEINMFYLKALQTLSTNVNILSQEQIDFLSQYTDNVPYNDDEINRDVIKSFEEASMKKEPRFGYEVEFEQNASPIKSGLIALIYYAKLDSKPVIIKVMRQGIREQLRDALRKIDFFVSLISWLPIIRNLQLSDILSENHSSMISQTNFTNEKDNIIRMFNNCKNTDYINVPKVYPEFTEDNESIIVMSYLEGRKMDELEDGEKDEYSRLLAKFGIKCLLFNRFYHADLHSGNIVFMRDTQGNPQLGILDYGIMGEISKQEQHSFYNFFKSMASTRDNKTVADSVIIGMVQPLSALEKMASWDYNNLREDTGNIIGNILDQKRNFTPHDIYNINSVLRKYGLRLSRSFCRIEMSLAIADSVSSKLSHTSNYLENVKEVVKSMFDTNIVEY